MSTRILIATVVCPEWHSDKPLMAIGTIAVFVWNGAHLPTRFVEELVLLWPSFVGARFAALGTAPWQVYANKGWAGWGDWLGTGTIATRQRRYQPFKKARAFVRSLGLKGTTEWREFCKGSLPAKGKLPQDIPAVPLQTYANKGWAGMSDWLGAL